MSHEEKRESQRNRRLSSGKTTKARASIESNDTLHELRTAAYHTPDRLQPPDIVKNRSTSPAEHSRSNAPKLNPSDGKTKDSTKLSPKPADQSPMKLSPKGSLGSIAQRLSASNLAQLSSPKPSGSSTPKLHSLGVIKSAPQLGSPNPAASPVQKSPQLSPNPASSPMKRSPQHISPIPPASPMKKSPQASMGKKSSAHSPKGSNQGSGKTSPQLNSTQPTGVISTNTVGFGSKKTSPQVSPGNAPEIVPISAQVLTTKRSSKPSSPKSPRSGRQSHEQDVFQAKLSQGLAPSPPRKSAPLASKSSSPLRSGKSSKSPSPSRGKSSSSRNSPQMDGVVSPPSSLNGKNSLGAETLRVFDPETMRIRQFGSGYGMENASVEGPWDYEPGPPFTLTVAGVCDANDMYYFPLQEQIIYLESKLIDMAMRYNNLEDEHRLVRQSHEQLIRTIREANLVARDQVVFENLKLKYQLVATELEDARKLIRELRQLGWEHLPQRMLYECKKTHDEMEEIIKQRDDALHEHSAAKGIASEALKQVKVLKRSMETHKKMSDKLMAREREMRERYDESVKLLNMQWEEKLLHRHARDKRRQQHMALMLEEERAVREIQEPHHLEDITFRANLVYRYPTLVECVEDALAVRGKDLGLAPNPELDKSWQVTSKVSTAMADHLLKEAARSNTSGTHHDPRPASRTASGLRSQIRNRRSTNDPHNLNIGEETEAHPVAPPTDAERSAWDQMKNQLRKKLAERDEELNHLRRRVKELEEELTQVKAKTKTENEMAEEIKRLNDENEILVEHYLSEMNLRKKYLNMYHEVRGNIRVYCRIRPDRSADQNIRTPVVVYTPDAYTVLAKVPRGLKVFHMDRAYPSTASQEDVYEDFATLVQSVIDGYNVCIIAFGENKTGKTYTLTGDKERPGLTPRIINHLFELLEDPTFRAKCYYDVNTSMVELRNERFYDLFADYGGYTDFEITVDQSGATQLNGVARRNAQCAADFHEHYHKGLGYHRANELKLSEGDTKSHVILTVTLMTTNKVTNVTNFGKLTFVDLASHGSLTTKDHYWTTDSVLALKNVITCMVLAQPHIPYRSSKLTTLLQDSLGGSAKTLVIATVNESEAYLEQTIDTLDFASRLKMVENHPQRSTNSEQVVKLKTTTERLKRGEFANG